MAQILYGAPVAGALREKSKTEAAGLRQEGISPLLALLRIGDRADGASYAASLEKKAPESGVKIRRIDLPGDCGLKTALEALKRLNEDPLVHGILLLRPLTEGLDEAALCRQIAPGKDVDCATDLSMAGVFTGKMLGFPPATPRAVLELLRFYGISPAGRHVVVLGRSLVVGRPLAMLLLQENATVTLCHSQSRNLAEITRRADILVAAAGQPEMVGASLLGEGQILIDVGIHRREDGSLCGDIAYQEAEPRAAALTPVPGGIGAVTTAVLLGQVVEAALRTKG